MNTDTVKRAIESLLEQRSSYDMEEDTDGALIQSALNELEKAQAQGAGGQVEVATGHLADHPRVAAAVGKALEGVYLGGGPLAQSSQSLCKKLWFAAEQQSFTASCTAGEVHALFSAARQAAQDLASQGKEATADLNALSHWVGLANFAVQAVQSPAQAARWAVAWTYDVGVGREFDVVGPFASREAADKFAELATSWEATSSMRVLEMVNQWNVECLLGHSPRRPLGGQGTATAGPGTASDVR